MKRDFLFGMLALALASTTLSACAAKQPRQVAPVVNEATTAYQFRTRIKTDPRCTVFANDADAVFLRSDLDNAKKAEALTRIAAQATAAACLTP